MVPGAQWGGWAPLFLGALHRGAAPQVGLETGGSLAAHPRPQEIAEPGCIGSTNWGCSCCLDSKDPPIFPGCGQAGNHLLLLCRCIGDGQRGSEQHSLTQCPQPALHLALGSSPSTEGTLCVYRAGSMGFHSQIPLCTGLPPPGAPQRALCFPPCPPLQGTPPTAASCGSTRGAATPACSAPTPPPRGRR